MDKRITYFALVIAGFAAVVAIGSLVSVNRAADKFQAEKDRRLELEARVAKLEKQVPEVQAATLQELATRLEEICVALQLDCGEPAEAAAAPTVPDEFLAAIAPPKTAGTRIEVAVPGEVTGAILTNVQVLEGELGALDPAAHENRPDGFRIGGLRDGGLAKRLGFAEGDVIRAVNGMPFTTQEEIVKVYEALADGRAASISFDLRRGGNEMTLVIRDPARQPKLETVR